MSLLKRPEVMKKFADESKGCKTCGRPENDCSARYARFKPTEMWPQCFFWVSDGTLLTEDEARHPKRDAQDRKPV